MRFFSSAPVLLLSAVGVVFLGVYLGAGFQQVQRRWDAPSPFHYVQEERTGLCFTIEGHAATDVPCDESH